MRPPTGLPRLLLSGTIVVAFTANAALAQGAPTGKSPALRLARLFGDGVVLQREKPIAIWGWAEPSADVSITFRGHTTHAKSTAAGTWSANLPPQQAGGRYALSVRSGEARVDLRDVLVGDVWVASGQSNMEFTVSAGNNAAHEVTSAHDSLIRQFKVPTSWANSPEADLAGGGWTPADSQHVGAFTAVGYFFARDLRKSLNVPIGLINTTWGGSNIETWMSRRAQHISDSAWAEIQRGEDARMTATRNALRMKLGELPTKDPGLVNDKALWADPSLDESAWSDMPVPSYWEDHGYAGMDGVAWYRVSVDLNEPDQRDGATIAFAAIDDDDITWVNGVEVGRTAGYNVARVYHVPATVLRAGRNVIAVRVTDGGGGGGIYGAASLTLGNRAPRSLAGVWKFRVGEVALQPDGQQINKVPSVLYNKMLYPILPFAIKGVLWYQGESNANNVAQASAYRDQFRTLITSWRHEWNSGRNAFPFLWVQLPNFGAPDTVPPASASWATQRESMAAALSLPKTGQAIAIDVGDAANLHPRNKQDVGARLSRVARRVVYGESIVASGPTYRSHVIRGDTVVITFGDVGAGLVTHSGDGRVGGFSLAAADRKFAWAEAKIVGNTVHVWSDRVTHPVAVRYAWANNPDQANLYNRERLPAAPFRTDRW
jgi:sialate O-acetylesterase